MKKIKILFIITHLELGGAQNQLLLLIKNLNPCIYDIHLISGKKGYLKDDFLRIPYLKIKFIEELKREINPLWDLIALIKIYLYIKKKKFDIIHTHSPKAGILGRWAAFFAGIRNSLYTVHGWPFHKFMNPITYAVYLFLEKITAKITKKIIVVSKEDLFTGIKKVTYKNKFILIHYGIDVDLFRKLRTKRKYYDNSRGPVITVASLKPQKGLNYFLNMAKEITEAYPRIKFYIVGDGPLKNKIKKKIKTLSLQDKVYLMGWKKNILPIYEKASIFVLTSLWEGLPVALIEAISAGIPVIVTDTGGVKDIMCEDFGILVKLEEISTVGKVCKEVLQNYSSWNRIIESAEERFLWKYWSYRRMVKEMDSFYRNLFLCTS